MKKPIAGTAYTYWGGIAANKERLGHEPNSVTDAKDKYYSGDYAADFARRIAEKKKRYSWDKMTYRIGVLFSELKKSIYLGLPFLLTI